MPKYNPTVRDLLELLKTATDEQLDREIELLVTTYTTDGGYWPRVFAIALHPGLANTLRIDAAFPEGVSIHTRKKNNAS